MADALVPPKSVHLARLLSPDLEPSADPAFEVVREARVAAHVEAHRAKIIYPLLVHVPSVEEPVIEQADVRRVAVHLTGPLGPQPETRAVPRAEPFASLRARERRDEGAAVRSSRDSRSTAVWEKKRTRSDTHRRAKAGGAIGRAAVVERLDEQRLREIPCPLGEELLQVAALVVARLEGNDVEQHELAPDFVHAAAALSNQFPQRTPERFRVAAVRREEDAVQAELLRDEVSADVLRRRREPVEGEGRPFRQVHGADAKSEGGDEAPPVQLGLLEELVDLLPDGDLAFLLRARLLARAEPRLELALLQLGHGALLKRALAIGFCVSASHAASGMRGYPPGWEVSHNGRR